MIPGRRWQAAGPGPKPPRSAVCAPRSPKLPQRPAPSTTSLQLATKRKSVKFAGKRRAEVVNMEEDRSRPQGPPGGGPQRRRWARKGLVGGNGDAEEEVPEVRGLLLQEEHAVRAEPRRAVPHLPARRPRPPA